MSKPALGRGLASLLQEETERGAVKAPGLVAAKDLPAEGSGPVEAAGSPAPSPIAEIAEIATTPAPLTAAVAPAAVAVPSAETSADPVPRGTHPAQPLSTPAQSAQSPASAPVANPPMASVPASSPLPGWMVPALMVGDVVVVLSGILWASWGRGWGRWPWIAALFAVGCSQALVALFLSRSGASGARHPFSSRPPAGPGPVPGIRVRFVEEQIPGRRGDRR